MDTTSYWHGLQVRHWIFHPNFNDKAQLAMAVQALSTKFSAQAVGDALVELLEPTDIVTDKTISPTGAATS